MVGCAPRPPEVIIITATFPPPPGAPLTEPTLTALAAGLGQGVLPQNPTLTVPSATITSAAAASASTQPAATYVVQPGDTLIAIASTNNTTLEALLAVNSLADPDNLFVGQTIVLPPPPDAIGLSEELLPDRRLVRSVEASAFDSGSFILAQAGFLRSFVEIVDGQIQSGAEIVERVALEFSIDPRLLLAALEHQSGWLTNSTPSEEARLSPLRAVPFQSGQAREGLYRQLTWAADQLNFGYYGWKTRNLAILNFADGQRVRIAESLNAATVGIQYWLSRTNDYPAWQGEAAGSGFMNTYRRLFGDPYADGRAPLIPAALVQPNFALPFGQNEIWYFTGGPHGGYGAGSAWGAVDFAPPDDISQVTSACYVSQFFARAVAPGVIARTAEGTVILDLDGDGNEATGWSILYLHIDDQDRISAGTAVAMGDPIGRPSCDGGFSNATHMHIARRYNGEWLPTDCPNCRVPEGEGLPQFVLGGWQVVGILGQEYQGSLTRPGDRRVAEQGRNVTINQVSW